MYNLRTIFLIVSINFNKSLSFQYLNENSWQMPTIIFKYGKHKKQKFKK